jgi:Leucine-rich repeat (LRR) protein
VEQEKSEVANRNSDKENISSPNNPQIKFDRSHEAQEQTRRETVVHPSPLPNWKAKVSDNRQSPDSSPTKATTTTTLSNHSQLKANDSKNESFVQNVKPSSHHSEKQTTHLSNVTTQISTWSHDILLNIEVDSTKAQNGDRVDNQNTVQITENNNNPIILTTDENNNNHHNANDNSDHNESNQKESDKTMTDSSTNQRQLSKSRSLKQLTLSKPAILLSKSTSVLPPPPNISSTDSSPRQTTDLPIEIDPINNKNRDRNITKGSDEDLSDTSQKSDTSSSDLHKIHIVATVTDTNPSVVQSKPHISVGLLNLANNILSHIPTDILQLPQLSNLKILDLSNNLFESLPPALCKLSGLRILYLQRNFLKNLPSEIGELKNLRYLSLYDNLLESLPREIGGLKKLRVLHLQFNNLIKLPFELCSLPQIEEILVLSIQKLNSWKRS